MKTELTSVRLRELLHYDPESGDFTWRVGQNSGLKQPVKTIRNNHQLRG